MPNLVHYDTKLSHRRRKGIPQKAVNGSTNYFINIIPNMVHYNTKLSFKRKKENQTQNGLPYFACKLQQFQKNLNLYHQNYHNDDCESNMLFVLVSYNTVEFQSGNSYLFIPRVQLKVGLDKVNYKLQAIICEYGIDQYSLIQRKLFGASTDFMVHGSKIDFTAIVCPL